MINSDTLLDAIKEAEASLAKLTMKDKLFHPPPDSVSICTLDMKRMKISDTAPTPVKTPISNVYQQLPSSSRENTSKPSKKYKAPLFRVHDPKRQLKRMRKVKQLEKYKKKIAALEAEVLYKQTLVSTNEYKLYKSNHTIINMRQKVDQLTERVQSGKQALGKLYHESGDGKDKQRVIVRPRSIIAGLKRKRSRLVHTARNNDHTNTAT